MTLQNILTQLAPLGVYIAPALVMTYLIVLPIVKYLLDPAGLRKYPSAGGGIAGFTSLWMYVTLRSLRRCFIVDEEHRKLGEVIRIQPNHLSINIPEAAKDIYGHQSTLIKADFYEVFKSALGEENIVGTRDKSEHARKRKMISAGFAASNIIQMQPTMRTAIEAFLDEFDKFAEIQKAERNNSSTKVRSHGTGAINLRLWTNYLTFDMIGLAGYSESMGFVKNHDDAAVAEPWNRDQTYTIKAIAAFHNVSAFESLLALWPELLPRSRQMLWWFKPIRDGHAFIDMCTHKLKRRLKQEEAGVTEFKDLFGHYLTNRQGKEQGLTLKELITESNVILNAGSDTTATSLCNTLYLLYRHPRILAQLREELAEALPEDTIIPHFDQVKNLPFLQACIMESLRVRPPLSLGLPRKTTQVTVIAGHTIPAGVTISTPTWSIHRNAHLFSNPVLYNPSRWLGPELPALKEYVMPFSQGPRACIGRNLASLELSVCVPAIAMRYDLVLPTPEWELPVFDRHVANPGDCPVNVHFRQK